MPSRARQHTCAAGRALQRGTLLRGALRLLHVVRGCRCRSYVKIMLFELPAAKGGHQGCVDGRMWLTGRD